jgi:hypothetical protein
LSRAGCSGGRRCQLAFHARWLDPVAGFIIAAFAIHEAREA